MPIKRSQTPAPSHATRCLRAGASAAAAATVFGPGSPASSSDDPLVDLNARGRLRAVESSGSFSCQRCFKDAMRNDEVCAWVRHASYRKCKRCQRLGKPCEKIPLQCCRRAAVWVATAPEDRDKKGYGWFIAEMEAITKHLDENENVHVMRSLNRNVFRLLGVMSIMAGVPSPAPEEVITQPLALEKTASF
ncbi:hypothetical protein IFM46972_04271 [Aspergillus udagawae]|uniref:Uncharacterized protein n=1 Tax=Aspergillus udagawae TaxID=91492 RepID=A0A8H3NMC0_9EURO|nr:hypothetical protein IFM46972_04271 [Aspergillus udagawae]